MIIVFRVDASIQMGTGHVMRCLTLAHALEASGAQCEFICRLTYGNLIEKIKLSGFKVYIIGDDMISGQPETSTESRSLSHSHWLDVSQEQDAIDCLSILQKIQPDWLVVDHYSLDKTWQDILKPHFCALMVIDDLGDRAHIADVLLDQNYGATIKKYTDCVPQTCEILTGTHYSLLRPEFFNWRQYSLDRRTNTESIQSILITLGGSDPKNDTTKLLQQISTIPLPTQTKIIVVMGATASHLTSVQNQAHGMSLDVEIKTDVSNMAELMSEADLAIGAAGSTTWERCCLGLPTIQLVIAENQRQAAEQLAKDNVVKLIESIEDLPEILISANQWISELSKNSQQVVDGLGASRVAAHIIENNI